MLAVTRVTFKFSLELSYVQLRHILLIYRDTRHILRHLRKQVLDILVDISQINTHDHIHYSHLLDVYVDKHHCLT